MAPQKRSAARELVITTTLETRVVARPNRTGGFILQSVTLGRDWGVSCSSAVSTTYRDMSSGKVVGVEAVYAPPHIMV